MISRVLIWQPVILAASLIVLLIPPTCDAGNLSYISGTLCLVDGDPPHYALAIDGIPETLELVGTNLASIANDTRIRVSGYLDSQYSALEGRPVQWHVWLDVRTVSILTTPYNDMLPKEDTPLGVTLDLQTISPDVNTNRPAFRVTLHNASSNDLAVALGNVRPERYDPTSISLIFQNEDGKKYTLKNNRGRFMSGSFAPPVPMIVLLPHGASYAMTIDFEHFWIQPFIPKDHLPPGKYTVHAVVALSSRLWYTSQYPRHPYLDLIFAKGTLVSTNVVLFVK